MTIKDIAKAAVEGARSTTTDVFGGTLPHHEAGEQGFAHPVYDMLAAAGMVDFLRQHYAVSRVFQRMSGELVATNGQRRRSIANAARYVLDNLWSERVQRMRENGFEDAPFVILVRRRRPDSDAVHGFNGRPPVAAGAATEYGQVARTFPPDADAAALCEFERMVACAQAHPEFVVLRDDEEFNPDVHRVTYILMRYGTAPPYRIGSSALRIEHVAQQPF